MAPRGHKTIKRRAAAPGDDALALLRQQGVESLIAEIESGTAAEEGARPRVAAQPTSPAPRTESRRVSATATAVDERTVRELAYRLWEERGRPEGDADRDWHEAERELRRGAAAERATASPAPMLTEQSSRRPMAERSAPRHVRRASANDNERGMRAQRTR